jgi:hypothetical protein
MCVTNPTTTKRRYKGTEGTLATSPLRRRQVGGRDCESGGAVVEATAAVLTLLLLLGELLMQAAAPLSLRRTPRRPLRSLKSRRHRLVVAISLIMAGQYVEQAQTIALYSITPRAKSFEVGPGLKLGLMRTTARDPDMAR